MTILIPEICAQVLLDAGLVTLAEISLRDHHLCVYLLLFMLGLYLDSLSDGGVLDAAIGLEEEPSL